MNLSPRIPAVFLCLLAAGQLLPCEAAPSAKTKAKPAVQAPKDPFVDLTPLPSGPGLVIADPVGPSPDLTNFGAGCTRWLLVAMGGVGELGKNPPLDDIASYLRSSHTPSFKLGKADAKKIGKGMGITHLMTGNIEGEFPSRITLTLTLWRGDNGAAVGSPLTLFGTATQIKDQLPHAAREVLKRLGITNPATPKLVIEDVETLKRVGTYELSSTGAIPKDYFDPGFSAKSKTPLEAVFDNVQGPDWDRLHPIDIRNFNVQVLHRVADRSPELLRKSYPAILAFRKKWPNNCNGAWLTRRYAYTTANYDLILQACRWGVRCNPGDSTGWAALAEAYGDKADSIRQAVTFNQITPAKWKQIQPLYALWTRAAWKAVRINPEERFGWYELSVASTFSGGEDVAVNSIWKAISLNPDDRGSTSWGFELFEPKWYNREEDTERLITFASKQKLASLDNQSRMFSYLATHDWQGGDLRDAVDRIFATNMASPEGWFGPGEEARRAEITALWKAALDHPNEAEGWRAVAEKLHDWHTTYSRHWWRPFSRDQSRMLGSINGFRLLAAKRWTETQPELKAWIELAMASAATERYIQFDDDPHAHILHEANRNTPALDYALGHYSHIVDVWEPTIRRLSKDRELWSELAPGIASNFEHYYEHAEPGNQEMAKLESNAKATTKVRLDAGQGSSFFFQQAMYYYGGRGKDKARSLKAARAWVKADYSNPWAHWNLGWRIEDPRASLVEFQETLRLKPDFGPAAASAAEAVNKSSGSPAEAEKMARLAVKELRLVPEGWLQLGIALSRRKKYAEAREHLTRAYAMLSEYDYDAPWQKDALHWLILNDKAQLLGQ